MSDRDNFLNNPYLVSNGIPKVFTAMDNNNVYQSYRFTGFTEIPLMKGNGQYTSIHFDTGIPLTPIKLYEQYIYLHTVIAFISLY